MALGRTNFALRVTEASQDMSSYKIAVVVDQTFGDKLIELAKHVHVWICDTPVNRQAVQSINAQLEPAGEWNGKDVTTFRISEAETPEEMIISRLPTIDMHHNEYSHNPGWLEIEVYGTAATPKLRQKLQDYGVTEFHQAGDGFICLRAEPVTA